MKKKVIYPNLEAEKAKNGDDYKGIASILNNSASTVFRKFKGQTDWTLSDIEALCLYYNQDYHYLFQREEA